MFQSIQYTGYNIDGEYNMYQLNDSCFVIDIISQYGSPSLKHLDSRISSALTMMTIARAYENKNRNVALNLAHYYAWLSNACGFYIDEKFIQKQFHLMKLICNNKNFMAKYFHNTCYYLTQQHLLPLI